METPARILRAFAKDIDPALRDLNTRQYERQERILKIAQHLMARFGRHAISFSGLATAMKMATQTLRFHYCDLDELLAEILRRHLMAIAKAFGQVPDGPDRPKALRAAYYAFTRTGFGGFIEAHGLLIHELRHLPPDLRETLEQMQHSLADSMAPLSDQNMAGKVLTLLDSPCFSLDEIELCLAPLPASPPAPKPKPFMISAAEAARPMVKPIYERHPDDTWELPPRPN